MAGKASYHTEAIVLGTRNWGDADKIAMLFTKERGRVTAAAFGCRRPRSALAACIQMFRCIDAELAEGQRMDTLRQCSLLRHYKRLQEDLSAMAYGSFLAELAWEIMPEQVPEPGVYALLLEAFSALERRNPRVAALAAAYQLMELSGMQPSYGNCIRCGREISGNASFCLQEGGAICEECSRTAPAEGIPYGASLREFLLALCAFDWKEDTHLQVRREGLLQAERILLGHLHRILGRPLKSVQFLAQLG